MFPSEYEAFKRYAELYPDNCTLLVDTYSVVKSGVPNAIRVFDEVLKPLGIRPKGVRIDSGDIAYLSKKARKMLDAAGYPDCGVCASNSLDEYLVRDLILQGAQVTNFGIGENMITSKSDPVFGGVYKPVSYTHLTTPPMYAARAPSTAASYPCARREPNSITGRPCAARTMRFVLVAIRL